MHAFAHTHLIAGDSAQGTLRGADFSGIVGEGGDEIALASRNIGKDVARKLHAVAGVTRESDNYPFKSLYIGGR